MLHSTSYTYRTFAIYDKGMMSIKNNTETETTKELAMYAKAMSHPIRLEILNILNRQSCCFTGDLVELLPIAQSTVSQHLKALKNAGLIQGEINPPRVKYCINKTNLEKAKMLFSTFLK